MFVIQILLPLYDNDHNALPQPLFERTKLELTDRFGGLTAYTRSPAEGFWASAGSPSQDDIVVFEVMSDQLDRPWWSQYKRDLENRFRQECVLIRAQEADIL